MKAWIWRLRVRWCGSSEFGPEGSANVAPLDDDDGDVDDEGAGLPADFVLAPGL